MQTLTSKEDAENLGLDLFSELNLWDYGFNTYSGIKKEVIEDAYSDLNSLRVEFNVEEAQNYIDTYPFLFISTEPVEDMSNDLNGWLAKCFPYIVANAAVHSGVHK